MTQSSLECPSGALFPSLSLSLTPSSCFWESLLGISDSTLQEWVGAPRAWHVPAPTPGPHLGPISTKTTVGRAGRWGRKTSARMQTPEAWASPAYPDSTAPVFSGPECSWLDSLTESSLNQADFQVLVLASGSRNENV